MCAGTVAVDSSAMGWNRLWVGAAATPMMLLAACTSLDTGVGVRDPGYDPLAVIATALDPGPFGTDPTPLGGAGDIKTGRQLESIRLSEYVIAPFDVEPSLVVGFVAAARRSGPLADADPWDVFQTLGVAALSEGINQDQLVAGFGVHNEAKIGPGGTEAASTAVLRFGTHDQAVANAEAILSNSGNNVLSGMPSSAPEAVDIPEHPETGAVKVGNPLADGLGSLVAATVSGDYVLLQTVKMLGGDKPMGSGQGFVAKVLDLQVPLLAKFHPTPVDKLTELPRDPTGLLSRTVALKAGDPLSDIIAVRAGTYGPRGALAYQLNPVAMSSVFSSSAMSTMVMRQTRIFVTAGGSENGELADELAAEAVANALAPADGIGGFPTASCYQNTEDSEFYCLAAVGKYVIDAFTDDDARTARQLLSAQYLLLPDDAK